MLEEQHYATEEPRADLCHKCGRCCRSATAAQSHEKLTAMAAAGNEDAVAFLRVFEPYESIEAARAVVPEQVDQVLAHHKAEDGPLTFYHCKHVSPEGLCGIYEDRPNFCKGAPYHGWSLMPPGCGFEGWQFAEREKQKQMIRSLKEQLFLLEQLSADGVHHPLDPEKKLAEMRALVDAKIEPWRRFGADGW
jgi:Fe-S-cluster containining protein